jgi:hypothetical protein
MQRESTTRSELTNVVGWHLSSVRYDSLHVIFLGISLDLLGSCLAYLARNHTDGVCDIKLHRLWLSCLEFSKKHGMPNCIEPFSKKQMFGPRFPDLANLLSTSGGGPCMKKGKARRHKTLPDFPLQHCACWTQVLGQAVISSV